MMNILYFGARPDDSLSMMFGDAGYTVVHARYTKGFLGSISTCAAVVLHWKSKRDQRVIIEAKAAGIPIVVTTSKLADAVQAGEPSADLYLEEPASNEEVTTMLIEMVTANKPIRVAAVIANKSIRAAAATNAG